MNFNLFRNAEGRLTVGQAMDDMNKEGVSLCKENAEMAARLWELTSTIMFPNNARMKTINKRFRSDDENFKYLKYKLGVLAMFETDKVAGKVALLVCCFAIIGCSMKEIERFTRHVLTKVVMEALYKANCLDLDGGQMDDEECSNREKYLVFSDEIQQDILAKTTHDLSVENLSSIRDSLENLSFRQSKHSGAIWVRHPKNLGSWIVIKDYKNFLRPECFLGQQLFGTKEISPSAPTDPANVNITKYALHQEVKDRDNHLYKSAIRREYTLNRQVHCLDPKYVENVKQFCDVQSSLAGKNIVVICSRANRLLQGVDVVTEGAPLNYYRLDILTGL